MLHVGKKMKFYYVTISITSIMDNYMIRWLYDDEDVNWRFMRAVNHSVSFAKLCVNSCSCMRKPLSCSYIGLLRASCSSKKPCVSLARLTSLDGIKIWKWSHLILKKKVWQNKHIPLPCCGGRCSFETVPGSLGWRCFCTVIRKVCQTVL